MVPISVQRATAGTVAGAEWQRQAQAAKEQNPEERTGHGEFVPRGEDGEDPRSMGPSLREQQRSGRGGKFRKVRLKLALVASTGCPALPTAQEAGCTLGHEVGSASVECLLAACVCALTLGFQLCGRVRKDFVECDCSMSCRAVGCPRASTIRKRVREWRKIRAYSMSVCGSPWPDHVGVLLDFILERVEEPCGHTVPESILATLAMMEKAGGVASGERLADNQALKNVVNQATHDLQLVAPPTRKAPLVPIMLIGSLELMVADDSAPSYARGLAFYKLLKIWASCRSNDLSGLNPSSLRLNSLGLCGVLERTKCSGPGKRVRHLPFFVCHSAALFVPNWLKLGWDIWDRPCLSFRRDYFLPLPKQDWSGARRVMADYADTVALSKSLFRMLRLPFLLGGWKASEAPLFSVQAALRFWKEHSERNWLTSHLAAIGVAQTERDYVGRWHVASCSDEYVRTAQHVVTNLQERLVSYFCNPIDKWGLRNAGLDELKLFLQEQGEDADLVCLQYEQLYLPPGWCRRVPEPPAVCASPVSPPEDLPEETDNVKEDCPYFVTVVGKQRLRRLHRRGGCGVFLIDVQESEPAWSLRGLSYDLACKHCWAAGEVAVSEAEEADDSGESASCSDSNSDSSTEQESCS